MCGYSFAIWQLRTSYLSNIKDGIGDRLINVNNTVLNTPGFRAAGWSSASTNPYTQTAAAHTKRSYSPPIPTNTAVSGDYYRLGGNRGHLVDRQQGVGAFGFGDDGEEEEGGMVTGKSSLDAAGRRPPGRLGKKPRRRERQLQEHHIHGITEEDDSSDLSDDSDDDAENAHRTSTHAHQISFSKVPIRTRAGSSPIRSHDNSDRPELMVTGPSHARTNSHYRTGSLGTAVNEQRPRRDTTTSSDLSSDNDIDSSAPKGRHIHFGTRNRKERSSQATTDAMTLEELNEENSGAESVGSALSSDFGATAGSGSLLEDVGITGSLDSSSPMAMMHKLPNNTASQNTNTSPRKHHKTPAPELQDLPPPRPISQIKPVSLLTEKLLARKKAPSNPTDMFAVLSGKGSEDALNIKIYIPFASDPDEPLDMPLARDSKLAEQPAPVIVAEAIGLALWQYSNENRQPSIERSKLTVNRWTLRMVEDGEVEYDFPALGRMSPITDFTSNNNNKAGGARGRSRGKQYDEFALVEASEGDFEENERLYPKFSQAPSAEESSEPVAAAAGAIPPSQTQGHFRPPAPRLNPILGQPFSSALNDSSLTPADRPAVPVSQATPRMGVSKTLKVRFINLEASTHVMTLNTSTDSYIAEILDSVCKRWGLDKGNYLLKVMGSNTVAPLDRTVEALGNITELDLVRRRFGAGPLALTGSPHSLSPNAPLLVDNNNSTSNPTSKKSKKAGQNVLQPLTQRPDLIGGYYRRYIVFRKQSMSFTASNQRTLTFDNDYMHIMPPDTGKAVSDTKTRSISFNDVVGCKVSRRHPKSFRVVVLRGNDATEQKRYDFEARNAVEAGEIVEEIKKNMAHYRI